MRGERNGKSFFVYALRQLYRKRKSVSTGIHYIFCSEYGQQEETFVCQHIVQSLEDSQTRGFHWSSEDNALRPDARCHKCDDKAKATDREWTEENMKFADIQLLCGLCYDKAKEINVKQNSFKELLTTKWNALVKRLL